MKRAFSLIILLWYTLTVFSQFNYRWIDIPVNNRANWTFFKQLDTLSKDPNFSKYTWDLQQRLTQTEIKQIDSVLRNALQPPIIRLSFAISADYKTIIPIALSVNRSFIKYSYRNHIQLVSDSISTEPLYIVPFSEYWHRLTFEQRSRIAEVCKELLDNTLFSSVNMQAYNYHFLNLDNLANSAIFDIRKLTRYLYEIPWMLQPELRQLSQTDLTKIVSPADTVYSEDGPIVLNISSKINSLCAHARTNVEIKETEIDHLKGHLLYSIYTDYIGIEMISPIPPNHQTIIWTKKNVLIDKLECPPLLNGIEYLWAEMLEKSMKN